MKMATATMSSSFRSRAVSRAIAAGVRQAGMGKGSWERFTREKK
jgi:hypothetical protein